MASATRLSRRTLGTLLAVSVSAVAVAGAGKIDYRSVKSLLQSTLTGPGSTSRIVVILVLLANLKNFPLVWHVGDPEYYIKVHAGSFVENCGLFMNMC